jgi:HEAT repeat protein
MGDSHGVTPLVDLLNDRDITVRLAAIQSLGMVRGAGAIEPLIRQLGDEDDEILYTAGESLRMQGADARVPLVNALRVGDHHFRARVATILESIGGIPEDPVEKAYFLIGKERWYDLEAVGAPALQPLIETLSDRNIHVRLGAVNAISKIGGADAIRLLVTALNDDSPIVRKRAEKALVTIGQPAVGVLRNALGSGSVRFPDIARSTLRKIIPGSDDCSPDGT